MKALVSIFILFYCLPILPQDFIKQISQIDNDARNLKFLRSGLYFFVESSEYVFESYSDSAINIYFGYYNPLTDSFYNQIPLTNNNYLNINPTGRKINEAGRSIVLYQSNRNGNWNLIARTKNNDDWSEEQFLFNSNDSETKPVLIKDDEYWFSEDSVRFLYSLNNSVYYATWKDTIIRNLPIFNGNDSTIYSSYSASFYWIGWGDPRTGHYIVAQKNKSGQYPQIVYRLLRPDGELGPETILAESPTLRNPSFSVMNFISTLHYEDTLNGKQNILVLEGWPFSSGIAYPLKNNIDGDLSDFISAPIYIVTRDQIQKNSSDIFLYEAHSFKLTTGEETFIRVNSQDFWFHPDTLLLTRVNDTPVDVCELGMYLSYVVFYTAWEDSLDGKIKIIGKRHLFDISSVRDDKNNLSFQLHQNYPNPFNPVTNIRYNLTERGFVVIKVFDVLGNELKTIVNTEQDAGEYVVNFDASEFSSGVYFYRMQINDSFQTRKMVLIR